MAGALTLIILVASGEADDRASRALLRATRGALGGESHVEVREVRDPSNDAQARAAEQRARADAVVELTWTDSTHRQARIRVHLTRSDRWVDRSIGFQPSDAPAERGRTIGFAVASMVPEDGSAPEAEPAPTPTPTPTPAPAPAPAPAPTPTPTLAGASPSSPAPTERPIEAQSSSGSGRPDRLEAVTLDVLGVGAAGGNDLAVGAAAAAQWFLVRPLAVRIAGGARAGILEVAQSTTLTLTGSAGVVLHALRASRPHRLGVWIRADYVVQRLSLTHFSSDSPTATMDRWLSGMDALVGVDWMFAPEVGLVAGLGIEDTFASTYVRVGGAPAATLPPLQGVAEAGFRLRF